MSKYGFLFLINLENRSLTSDIQEFQSVIDPFNSNNDINTE